MKIVLICGAGMVSGKEIMSLALLQGLKDRGHSCFCVTSSWSSPLFRERLAAMGIPFRQERIGFITKTFQWEAIRMTLHQLVYIPWLYMRFISKMVSFRPDVVVHTNFHHLFLLLPVLPWSRNLYWSHEITFPSRFYRILFRVFKARIDTFVAVSQAVGNSLTTIVGHEAVKIVRNGVTVPSLPVEVKKHERGKVIAIVGQVAGHKGHDLLLDAFGRIHQSLPDVRLRIVGVGEEQFTASLIQQVQTLGLTGKVDWCGYIAEKADIYCGVDLVVVPSRNPDPYPTAIMESGFFGIPVVGSDIGGIPEMISEGVNGSLFRNGDADSLADRIAAILTDPNFDQFRIKSRNFALANFAHSKFVEEFESILMNTKHG